MENQIQGKPKTVQILKSNSLKFQIIKNQFNQKKTLGMDHQKFLTKILERAISLKNVKKEPHKFFKKGFPRKNQEPKRKL